MTAILIKNNYYILLPPEIFISLITTKECVTAPLHYKLIYEPGNWCHERFVAIPHKHEAQQ